MEVPKSSFEVEETTRKQQQHARQNWIAPLCISHAAAAWGERSWEFGAGLLLLRLNDEGSGEELRLTAILVLAECTFCTLLGSRIGRAVDQGSFLGGAVYTLAIQNLGIAVAASFLVWAFNENGRSSLWLAIVAIVCSVVARLGSLGSTIATEKRWVTALAAPAVYGRLGSQEEDGIMMETDDSVTESSSKTLTKVNARLRCIDLSCNLLAPIAVGFVLESTSPTDAALSIAAFNAVAWPLEVACLVWIHAHYRNVLSIKTCTEQDSATLDEKRKPEEATTPLCQEWTIYYRQSIFRSALALAVLYLSVVSLGTLMTAWLAASGFHAGHLGVARAVAALSGMLSTVTTPRLVQSLGLDRTALRYIWYMWTCILVCTCAAFFSNYDPIYLWAVVVSVVVSRFGLWGFDLCITQMLQERIVPPEQIGAVNGVQVALQNAFDALAALSCVLLPDPNTFSFLILGSFGSVTVAALLQSCSSCRQSTDHEPA